MTIPAPQGSLPEFLAGFDPVALDADERTLVALDPDMRIVWVNTTWQRFAEQNGGGPVLERFTPGAVYLDGIQGELRPLYDGIFRRVLEEGIPHESLYECSSPERFREYRLRALPFARRGLLLEHTRVAERPHDRPAEPPDYEAFADGYGFITQCGNCRRIRDPVRQAWHWIPAWVASPPGNITHGICGVCVGYYYGRFMQSKRP